MRAALLALSMIALAACDGAAIPHDASRPDAFRLDAGRDAAVDAAHVDDVGSDAGQSYLALRGDARMVDACGDEPLLVWNGDGFGLTWRFPGCERHVRELAADGTPGASLPIADLPPAVGAEMPAATTFDMFSYAHGAYALDAYSCAFAGGDSCGGQFFGALARDATPLSWAAPGRGVLAVAGSAGRTDWLTLEKAYTSDTPPAPALYVVTRDASMNEVSHIAAPFDARLGFPAWGSLVAGTRSVLANWPTVAWSSSYLLLSPDGTPIGGPIPSGALLTIEPWGDDFLAIEREQTAFDVTTFDLLVIDGAGAGIVSRITLTPDSLANGSQLAALPERGLLAMCWQAQIPGPTGTLVQALMVQLADVATGTVLGPPMIAQQGSSYYGHDCASDGTTITVVWSEHLSGTFVQQLDVLR